MSYQRGDYAQGDYMRGDPSLFSGIAKFVTKTVGGFIRGGPLGAIAGAASALHIGGAASGVNPSNLPAIRSFAGGGPGMNMPGPEDGGGGPLPPVMTGGSGTDVGMIPAFASTLTPGGRRLHPNKSAYVTRGGGTSHWAHQLMLHAKQSVLVPTRRMNVANPRALRRSLRRVAGFAKLTKRVRKAVSHAASAVGVRRGSRKGIRRR